MGFMTKLYIILGIIILVSLIIKKISSSYLNKSAQNTETINDDKYKTMNFHVDKSISINLGSDTDTKQNGISDKKFKFDFNQKLMAVESVSYVNPSLIFYDLSRLNSVELVEDGNTIQKGRLTGSIVGATIAGTAGAVIGSNYSSNKTKSICSQLSLRLLYRSKYDSSKIINILEKPMSKSDRKWNDLYKNSQEIFATLKNIIPDSDIKAIASQQAEHENLSHRKETSVSDKLYQLQQLKNDNIITDEEFENKKLELLKQL